MWLQAHEVKPSAITAINAQNQLKSCKHYFTFFKSRPDGPTSLTQLRIIGERAKRVRHPLLLPIGKKCVYSTYVKTTMRMLTILREAEEWMRVHLQESCLLFASAITKSSLYVRQNDKAHAHQITLLSLAP